MQLSRQPASLARSFGRASKQHTLLPLPHAPCGLVSRSALPLGIASATPAKVIGITAGKRSTSRLICRDAARIAANELIEEAIRHADERDANPLEVALESAQAILIEKEQVREALEAEAQEVAQLAVEANEAKAKVEAQFTEATAALEEALRMEQDYANLLTTLQEKLATTPDTDSEKRAAISADITATQARQLEISQQVAQFKTRQQELQPQVVAAEAKAAKTEQIADAAMKAAETAVREEMQAAAMVKETQQALGKAMSQLSTLEGNMDAAALLAGDKREAEAEAEAASAAATTRGLETRPLALTTVPPIAAEEPAQKKSGIAKLLMFLGLFAAGYWALTHTAAGQQVIDTATGLANAAMEKVAHIHVHEGEKGVIEAIWLLFSSIICVPLVVKLVPGGSPVLGYLLGGAIVGPHALALIQDVENVKHLAELGVVFLLFNIGLELSLDRLQSMAKYVFGMGSMQVVLTLAAVAAFATTLAGLPGPSAIILGGALAMSTTAVAIQVLEDRGEMGSRHGRATFSVLLFQDLAVVVLLMLIPLLAPGPDGSSGGLAKIAQALGMAAVKACVCIVGIIAGGRLLIQPLYKKMSSFANAEIFAATTLLVVLGTSVLTSLAGLSLALGAFLAGLLIAETEYALQVESDIAPYKGLLLGLFFMSVGMEISAQLFIQKWQKVLAMMVLLVVGKVAVMVACGTAFGISWIAAARAGLLLAPGGEFAFVAFGEAVSRGVLPSGLCNELYLVVALSMAMTPYLAAIGGKMAAMLEKGDVKALQPQEEEMKELRDHVIIAGYGRAGQLIGQLLSENLIPFVALDVSNERVAAGKAQDLPVYFGDAGSPAVLHLVGAERAACAVIALDTPGANYRAVWAMTKHFPGVKTYVRAHDMTHALNLEKAGATAVVPEILEPSLQLAAAALHQLDWGEDEVTNVMDDFRRKHLAELQALSAMQGTSIGYGYAKQTDTSQKDGVSGNASNNNGGPSIPSGLSIAGASA